MVHCRVGSFRKAGQRLVALLLVLYVLAAAHLLVQEIFWHPAASDDWSGHRRFSTGPMDNSAMHELPVSASARLSEASAAAHRRDLVGTTVDERGARAGARALIVSASTREELWRRLHGRGRDGRRPTQDTDIMARGVDSTVGLDPKNGLENARDSRRRESDAARLSLQAKALSHTSVAPISATTMDTLAAIEGAEYSGGANRDDIAAAAAKRVGRTVELTSEHARNFCVQSGLPALGSDTTVPGMAESEAKLSISAARNACLTNLRCAGFTLAAAAPDGEVVTVRFFASATLTCDLDWISFVKGDACGPPSARSRRYADEAALGAAAGETASQRAQATASQRAQASTRNASGADAAPFGITLVTQLSEERMWMLRELASRWTGMVVASMWLKAGQQTPALPASLAARVTLVPVVLASAQYPINTLRNAAIREVRTSHYLVCDVDLWPSTSLHSELLRLDRSFFSTPRIAIVVAAFTLNPHALAGTSIAASMPRSLAELYACVRNRECTAFKGAADFVPGQHLATDYVRWWMSRAQALPYRIPCFDKVSYEPYLVVRKAWPNFAATDSRITADNQFNAAHGDDASAPVFDEEFTGYGKNKVQWVQQLRSRGFAFWTLPRGFLVHCPHAMSESGKKWQRNAGNHKARMDRLFEFQVAVSRAEEAEEALQPKNGDSVQKGGCPRRTPHCPVPLLQQVDMLQPAYLGKRTPSEVQG